MGRLNGRASASAKSLGYPGLVSLPPWAPEAHMHHWLAMLVLRGSVHRAC